MGGSTRRGFVEHLCVKPWRGRYKLHSQSAPQGTVTSQQGECFQSILRQVPREQKRWLRRGGGSLGEVTLCWLYGEEWGCQEGKGMKALRVEGTARAKLWRHKLACPKHWTLTRPAPILLLHFWGGLEVVFVWSWQVWQAWIMKPLVWNAEFSDFVDKSRRERNDEVGGRICVFKKQLCLEVVRSSMSGGRI